MFHIIYLRSVLRCRASPVMLAACRQSSSHGGCAGFNRSTPDFGWRMIMDFWILGTNAFWVQVKVLQMSFGAGLYFYPYSVLQSLGNPFFFCILRVPQPAEFRSLDYWISILDGLARFCESAWRLVICWKKAFSTLEELQHRNEQNKITWEEKSWF